MPAVWVVARQLLALTVGAGGGVYDARTRAVLCDLCTSMGVPSRLFARWESEIGGALFQVLEASQALQRQRRPHSKRNAWKIAGAAIGGGVLLALTGGLAAPALAAGLAGAGSAVVTAASAVGLAPGAVLLTSALAGGSTFLASLGAGGAAVIFGATGAGLTGWKMSTRWGTLQEFEFLQIAQDRAHLTMTVDVNDKSAIAHLDAALGCGSGRLLEDAVVPCVGGGEIALLQDSRCLGREATTARVPGPAGDVKTCDIVRFHFDREVDKSQQALHLTIFVAGWLSRMEDYVQPWVDAAAQFFPSSGHLSLKWESAQLERVSRILSSMVTSRMAQEAASFWLHSSIAAAAASGAVVTSVAAAAVLWPVWLISSMSNLDNAWLVAADRARQAGKCLAHVLADKHAVGQRPVSLVGHSMGARVIFYCLRELYDMGEFHAVNDVVLLGAPVTTDRTKWSKARAVVSGRLVNCYFWKDWILAFLYRYLEWGITVAGLSRVTVPGVENVDVSGLGFQSHADYPKYILDILALARMGEFRPRGPQRPPPEAAPLPPEPLSPAVRG